MRRIAKFEKVSFEQFKEAMISTYPETMGKVNNKYLEVLYEDIKLPKRATKGSAGYDFFLPFMEINMNPGKTYKIPTGIRVKIKKGWVLQCYPKSGLGFKYRLQLDNTVGIIDSDYYYSDNEGHIFAKITNDTNEEDNNIHLNLGDGFMQGIFVKYGITKDDKTFSIRNGGFGSTGK